MKKTFKIVYLILGVLIISGGLIYSYVSELRMSKKIEALESKMVTVEIMSFKERSLHDREYTEKELKKMGSSSNVAYDISIKKQREEGESIGALHSEKVFELLTLGKLSVGSKVAIEDTYLVENGEIAYSELDDIKIEEAFLSSINLEGK